MLELEWCLEQGTRERAGAWEQVWCSATSAAVSATDATGETHGLWTTSCHSAVWYVLSVHNVSV